LGCQIRFRALVNQLVSCLRLSPVASMSSLKVKRRDTIQYEIIATIRRWCTFFWSSVG
jgi:hypothetical protein